jgi:serine acetyltransferase
MLSCLQSHHNYRIAHRLLELRRPHDSPHDYRNGSFGTGIDIHPGATIATILAIDHVPALLSELQPSLAPM